MVKSKKGFTLMELMVAVIIVGILSSLAMANYTRAVERGRTAEARAILGQIRGAELAYYPEANAYTTSFSNLGSDINALPQGTTGACTNTNNYFRYSIPTAGAIFTAQAIRCTGGGKTPNYGTPYTLTLTDAGSGSQTGP